MALILERYEVLRDLFHVFDWSAWFTGSAAQQLTLTSGALEHVLGQEGGKEKLLHELSRPEGLSLLTDRRCPPRCERRLAPATRKR